MKVDRKLLGRPIESKRRRMERREWKREASNGLGKIYNVLCQEESLEKKGILFVLHGMQGHIGKYRYLFEYMAKQGYVVCGMDIQGHGKSANIPGYFGDNSGWESMIHDIHRSLLQIKKWFPNLPVFLFGHSMGSFLARDYAASYGADLKGLLLSGTAGGSPILLPVQGYIAVQKKLRGAKDDALKESILLAKYFNRHIPNPKSLSAWICTKEEVSQANGRDPLAVGFTLGAYADLLAALVRVNEYAEIKKLKDIPCFLFSGGADPVGEYGKGPASLYAMLKQLGNPKLKLHIFPKLRHEVLNEEVRPILLQEITAFMEEVRQERN